MRDWLRSWNFTIGKTIILGFGALLSLLVLQSVFSNLGLRRMVEGFSQTQKTHQESLDIYLFEIQVADLQRNVLAYNYSGYRGLVSRVEHSLQAIATDLKSLQGRVHDERRKSILLRMDGHLDSYEIHFQEAVTGREARDKLLNEDLRTKFDALRNALFPLVKAARDAGRHSLSRDLGLQLERLTQAHQMALDFINQPDIHINEAEELLMQMPPLLAQMDLQGLSPAQAALHRQVQADVTAYRKLFVRLVQSTRNYLQLLYVVMAGEAVEIGFLAKELEAETSRLQDEIDLQQQTQINRLVNGILGITLTALGLGAFIAWWLTRITTTPIKDMTRALTNLARGQMEVEIPGKGRSDEIGTMAMAAHVFKEKALELEHASRYKSEFLANMSHELRTPLNSLLILAKLLAENSSGNLTPDQVESAQVIHESGSDLLRLINDILDLSKVEAGRMEVMVNPGSLEDFLHHVLRQFQPLADAKGLALTTWLDPDLPPQLETDWPKVEQVLKNLISNAFKFTEQGAVSVKIRPPHRNRAFINPDLNPDNCCAITVRDTGIGIPEDKQQQIFEAFRQVDGTTSRKYGGTGLGLSISRRFAELLGGEVQVESNLGQGSAFTLYLPLEFPSWLPHQRLALDQRSHLIADDMSFSAPGATILVVDDDPRNHYALKQVLKGRVKEVVTAEHGQAALEVLALGKQVDLILMDIMMPIMSGTEATQAIRQLDAYRDLPIIALTAKVMAGDRERCLEAGANDYLAKPVAPATLFSCLQRWLPTAAAPSPPTQVTSTTKAAAPVAPAYPRLRAARVLIADDDIKGNFSLAQGLQAFCGEVMMAADGEKCLQLLQTNPVDLVLMDLMMPKLDGIEAIQRLRDNPAWGKLPIIAISAWESGMHAGAALSAGANAFMPKPLESKELLALMERLLGDHV